MAATEAHFFTTEMVIFRSWKERLTLTKAFKEENSSIEGTRDLLHIYVKGIMVCQDVGYLVFC